MGQLSADSYGFRRNDQAIQGKSCKDVVTFGVMTCDLMTYDIVVNSTHFPIVDRGVQRSGGPLYSPPAQAPFLPPSKPVGNLARGPICNRSVMSHGAQEPRSSWSLDPTGSIDARVSNGALVARAP